MYHKLNKISEKVHIFITLLTIDESYTVKIYLNDNINYKLTTENLKSNLFTTAIILFIIQNSN